MSGSSHINYWGNKCLIALSHRALSSAETPSSLMTMTCCKLHNYRHLNIQYKTAVNIARTVSLYWGPDPILQQSVNILTFLKPKEKTLKNLIGR